MIFFNIGPVLINPFLYEYLCHAPPTMHNYMNKCSSLYIDQRNYLSDPILKGHILSKFHKQAEQTLIRQLLQELSDLGLLCLQKVSLAGKRLR